jgi:hypothetical protein
VKKASNTTLAFCEKAGVLLRISSFDTKDVRNTVSIADAAGMSFPFFPESLLAIPNAEGKLPGACEGKLLNFY